MKKLAFLFAFSMAIQSLAQDTTRVIYQAKTLTLIAFDKPNENTFFKDLQINCDSIEVTRSCHIAQIWEIEDGIYARKSQLYKVIHQKTIEDIHQIAKIKFVICRTKYDKYQECLSKKGSQ